MPAKVLEQVPPGQVVPVGAGVKTHSLSVQAVRTQALVPVLGQSATVSHPIQVLPEQMGVGALQVSAHRVSSLQLLVTMPHATPLHASTGSPTQPHFAGEPMHVSKELHALQLSGSVQPLFASSGTHLLSHGLVSGPQVPMLQVFPVQTSVPLPGLGQPAESQPVSVQP
jgi:hypothetical protein